MLRDLQKAVPWIAVFVLSLVAVISATRAARHCLLHREFHIKVGVVHRMDARFWEYFASGPTLSHCGLPFFDLNQ